MKLGFFIMPVHPLTRPYAETLREDRDAFILADKLGYSEGYCGEHLTDLAENIPSSLMFCASLAGYTRQIKLGTAVVNLPFCHPVLVAAHAALVDNLLEGRFLLGIGAGILRTYALVVFPLLWPVTATVAVLIGIVVWNEFFIALVFLPYAASVLVLADSLPDRAAFAQSRVPVLATHDITQGKGTTYTLSLAGSTAAGTPFDIRVPYSFYASVRAGSTVCLRTHPGTLGWPWVEVLPAIACPAPAAAAS